MATSALFSLPILVRRILKHAQQRIKQQDNNKQSERILQVRYWVYLKLQFYRQTSEATRRNFKLSAKFCAPFQVIATVGTVAYKLQLPPNANIYPVFHVSVLKLGTKGTPILDCHPFIMIRQLTVAPEELLQTRTAKRDGHPVLRDLIKWLNLPPQEPSFLLSQFINFQPSRDKKGSKGKGIVT